ncbi:recombination protein NinG [Pseudomonas aeruginosa]|uniref:recombination protein NinG n=1 Tax=Pseudomonas aeruginosa TaxID=287 RepID=UPI00071B94F2|nr:recombination protein NinG [Pseudomonas aeruginosa]EIU1490517.1 recombination protein NinG [Pseudomonas aeruginosa]EIU2786397.1 recombination protein NinG [Pseudomonas aeruginosa]EIU3165521.1 recombination protein NinG [Pseudomonas aeruginosa]EIU3356716.1 recombination protein NinG [Pseudomonas aeruginosa]EIU3385366.1 recombination protein NinG [Pseudomonas aeruginosa]
MTLSVRSSKPRKCQNPACGKEFIPQRFGQRVCSPSCALAIKDKHAKPARKAIADRERREVRVRKEKLKSRSDHLREAQQAFNEFIRWRDRIAGHACISSGLPLDWSGNQTDAGHYRSTGAAPHLRFNENNCHAQRKLDNRYLSGNAVDYRVGLIARIGLAAVEELEADNSVRKYTVEDLKAIKAHYRAKVRELKKRIA